MISYVDVLSILLVFFLIVAAKLFAEKTAVHPVTAHRDRSAETTPPNRADFAGAQRRLKEHGLDARVDARGLVISIPQTIFFASGQSNVSPKALPTVSAIADVLREMPNRVVLVGHADAVPIHNRRFRSNWELSMARSLKMLELLSKEFGIPESRLSIASYGANQPAAPNATVEGRASNRRAGNPGSAADCGASPGPMRR